MMVGTCFSYFTGATGDIKPMVQSSLKWTADHTNSLQMLQQKEVITLYRQPMHVLQTVAHLSSFLLVIFC